MDCSHAARGAARASAYITLCLIAACVGCAPPAVKRGGETRQAGAADRVAEVGEKRPKERNAAEERRELAEVAVHESAPEMDVAQGLSPAPALPSAAPPPAPRPHRAVAKHKARSAGIGPSGLDMAAGGLGYGRAHGSLAAHGPLQTSGSLARPLTGDFNTEAYAHRRDNPFVQVADTPLSTFSIDVDTASYSNVRRFLLDGQQPPADAVRVEELINYFRYRYPEPAGDAPFGIHTEVASAPWSPRHRLVQIGLRARDIAQDRVPARNLVFLVDVSGSMQSPDKLPLLKRGLALLARQLRKQDRIAIAVYAGSSGLALPSTPGNEQGRILAALEGLEAGGSTNGAEGIELAYHVAERHFVPGGINRVVLATDGDFNVGLTSEGELTRLIEQKRASGVFLTVLGFGTGNLKDATMELLADKGNGNYAYIDSLAEAQKVLVREAGSTLVTVAKDVKIQVEWNPARVASYRLIGYENRLLADRDFNDDTKDAGEVGAGHTVTALYEIELREHAAAAAPAVDPLKYQSERAPTAASASAELLTLKVRYKRPDGDRSALLSRAVTDAGRTLEQSSEDFRWAAAVAGFGMLLRGSPERGDLSFAMVQSLARSALGADPNGDRRELLQLVARAAGHDAVAAAP